MFVTFFLVEVCEELRPLEGLFEVCSFPCLLSTEVLTFVHNAWQIRPQPYSFLSI